MQNTANAAENASINRSFLQHDEDYEMMYGNVTQNITDLAVANPQIKFYLYWTPYSIYYWDSLNQTGTLEMQIEAQEAATELLLENENIYVFSFFDEYEMICNPDNYLDILHFGEEINSQILKWICAREHLLTKGNYEQYYNKIREYYINYDYEGLWR